MAARESPMGKPYSQDLRERVIAKGSMQERVSVRRRGASGQRILRVQGHWPSANDR